MSSFFADIAGVFTSVSDAIFTYTPRAILFTFALTGFLVIYGKIWSYFRMLWSVYLSSGNHLRSYGKKGSWVLITGASDGIGKEFALQIARSGYNILLVSRTQSKLDAVAAEVEKPNDFFQSKAQTLAIDFASPKEEDYERLGELVRELDIAVLINNVGLSHQFPEPFAITDVQVVKDIIAVNCLATLRVTQLVLPGMIQRKKGLVLTLGSFGGLVPSPLLATYSASKSFLQHWSTAVASELDGSGVDVRFVVPYHITGSMSKIRKPSFFIPDVGPYVKSVLRKIGRRGGSTHFAYSSTPYPSHALMQWVLENTLGAGSQTIITQVRSMHQGIRARALKKLAREGKKN